MDAALPVLRASRGRAFLLFTTLRAMNRARERIADALAREGLDLPLLVQGEAQRPSCSTASARWATRCCWASGEASEGVDVAGDALSVVVIDKLLSALRLTIRCSRRACSSSRPTASRSIRGSAELPQLAIIEAG